MKLFKYQTKEPICYYETNKQVEIPKIYYKKNFRAMWVSNVVNIDLPTTKDIDLYQVKVIKMLDTCIEFNLNAIIFQVRTTNDAFYKSKLNPYSRYLTGKEGKEPPFDVLKWIIKESKDRGIEFHAWCNPYRISSNGDLSIEKYLNTCDDLNFAKMHPEYIILDKTGKLILNPAIQEVKDFITESMIELARNYDIDGIHWDDYFYPYNGLDDNYNDEKEFNIQSLNLGDFRRKNVNDIVETVNKELKKIKPKLRFGISPFGIWKNQKTNEFGSNTSPKCTESYYSLYADTLTWINKNYIDYVAPQIYWSFGNEIAPFADICDFWQEVCKESKVDLYIGHGVYRLGSEGDFSNKEEIVNQVKYANSYKNVKGNVFFTYKNFIEKKKTYDGMQELRKLLNEEY